MFNGSLRIKLNLILFAYFSILSEGERIIGDEQEKICLNKNSASIEQSSQIWMTIVACKRIDMSTCAGTISKISIS